MDSTFNQSFCLPPFEITKDNIARIENIILTTPKNNRNHFTVSKCINAFNKIFNSNLVPINVKYQVNGKELSAFIPGIHLYGKVALSNKTIVHDYNKAVQQLFMLFLEASKTNMLEKYIETNNKTEPNSNETNSINLSLKDDDDARGIIKSTVDCASNIPKDEDCKIILSTSNKHIFEPRTYISFYEYKKDENGKRVKIDKSFYPDSDEELLFISYLNNKPYQFANPGDHVTGIVCMKSSENIWVDIGNKYTALINAADYEQLDIKVGDTVYAYVCSVQSEWITLKIQQEPRQTKPICTIDKAKCKREMYTITCDNCGSQAQVPFDLEKKNKEVLCSNCFAERQNNSF